MKFQLALHTDAGAKKTINQDALLVQTATTWRGRVCFAAVCDGVGGMAKGELASSYLIHRLAEWFETSFADCLKEESLESRLAWEWTALLETVGDAIRTYGLEHSLQMGTTALLLLIAQGRYYIANVGDCRACLLDQSFSQLTVDQTYIQREIDAGRMSPREARRDPHRHMLLQCVGASQELEPDFYMGRFYEGSTFLLCSDGFSHTLKEEEIFRALSSRRVHGEEAMKKKLVSLTEVCKKRGESDNISAVLIHCEEEG